MPLVYSSVYMDGWIVSFKNMWTTLIFHMYFTDFTICSPTIFIYCLNSRLKRSGTAASRRAGTLQGDVPQIIRGEFGLNVDKLMRKY